MHEEKELKKSNWSDYFPGAVPAGEYFKITLNDLREILESSPEIEGINSIYEISFIGLISYFEAFCKDHFASLINIIPELIENLKEAKQDVSIDSTRILLYGDDISHKIGFIVAEKYDFGSANKINALFKALLNVSPFSKDSKKKYDDILRDRNLFVHHGGIYTLTYLQQSKLVTKNSKERAFYDSLVLDKSYLNDKLNFVEHIANKMLKTTNEALNHFISAKELIISKVQQKAINALLF